MRASRHVVPLLSFVACALAGAVAQTPQLPGVQALGAEAAAQLGRGGVGVAVLRGTEVVHRGLHGGFAPDVALPIASASKWLAVATVLTLVDDGTLDLDVPVARYVEELDRADKRDLTLRQCLACTGGLAARLADRMRGWDMKDFAAAVADAPLRAQPGSSFRYGGVGFQLAAVAAERASKKRWHELFEARIAAPLGMASTRFGTLLPPGGDAGTTALPWVAGGAVSTLDDYTRFLRMLAGRGEVDGVRVLRETSVAAMFRDQVPERVEVQAVGFAAERVRYGLGTWLEPIDGTDALRASDPGAFGFTPWLDLDGGGAGVFAVRDRVQRVLPHVRRVQDEVRVALRSPAVAGTAETVALDHGGRDRRYHLHLPPNAQAKAQAGLPLLLVLHGGGGSGEQVRETTGLAELGVRAGFVVAFPDGTGPLKSRLLTWNSGDIAVYAAEHGVDDVGFLRAVVLDVQRRVAIDPQRVWATGHSNGGMMCHRLAREAADVFAGIAVVAGAMDFTAVDAADPIAALLVHGTADEHVRIDGGRPRAGVGRAADRRDAALQAAVDYYVARNALSAHVDERVDGKVAVRTWAHGKDGKAALPVRTIVLDGGGHAWPGAAGAPRAGADAAFPFGASAAIVEFFASLPERRPAAAAPGR
jgi:polyhydroxybutyrate depolymerase